MVLTLTMTMKTGKKMLKFNQFCNFKEHKEKSGFLKIAVQAIEAGHFLSEGFSIFEAHFLIKMFLIKKRV